MVRIAGGISEYVLQSPAGSLLKPAVAAIGAVGVLDSLAGASSTGLTYTYTLLTGNPPQPSPYTVVAGAQMTPVSFSVVASPAQPAPQSWVVFGPMPPGVSFGNANNSVSGLGSGQAQGVNVAMPSFFGTPSQPGDYVMKIQAFQLTNGGGYSSSIFTYEVIVSGTATAPTFTTQPKDLTIRSGGQAIFSALAAGYPAPTYQWNFNGAPITGATSTSLSIVNLSAANVGNYTVVATNSGGSATSRTATLTVSGLTAPPQFTVQPSSVTVAAGATAVLSVSAFGTPTPTYTWTLNGAAISGATDATLVIPAASATSTGTYACVASNSAGTATSNSAILGVMSTADPGRLINLSCRAAVGTQADILIVGFASGGNGTTGTQPVLVRATGPALIPFGVTGTLPDPQLSLYNGSTLVASNSGWAGSAAITAADHAVGAFGLTDATSKDCALYIPNLAPNSYSAQIAGAASDTGIALAEVYDATAASAYTPSSPRLINLSARVRAGTGSSVLTAGFVIGGSTAKTVLIRASGPALAPFGVSGVLPDPMLKLYSGDTIVATNSSWAGSAEIASTSHNVGGFAWTDPTSKDSALLITLPPGGYSAQVAGAGGSSSDTGIALVEVYDVP